MESVLSEYVTSLQSVSATESRDLRGNLQRVNKLEEVVCWMMELQSLQLHSLFYLKINE